MLSGMYSAAMGIEAAQVQQQVIAENLAHVDVPGYRAQFVVFESFAQHYAALTSGDVGRGVQPRAVYRDFSTGHVKHTERSLDVAIDGEGWFAINTPEGVAYTRNGVFFTDDQGTLVTAAGYPVRGNGGATLQVPPGIPAEKLIIGQDGTIRAGGTAIGQLDVFRFKDPDQLEAVGVALFRPAGGEVPEEVAQPRVMQGYRELSNVSATSELIKMLVGVRYHEASQKALTTLSEAISDHINAQGG